MNNSKPPHPKICKSSTNAPQKRAAAHHPDESLLLLNTPPNKKHKRSAPAGLITVPVVVHPTTHHHHHHPNGPKDEPVSASFTITFSKVVENGVGMEKIGTIAKEGFTDEELASSAIKFEASGARTKIVNLNESLPEHSKEHKNASVLVIKGACSKAFNVDPVSVRKELFKLGSKWDAKKLMRGKVKTCQARRNMCISETAQKADIKNGKGTIIAWSELPELNKIRKQLGTYLGCKAEDLNAEGNFYHHQKAGIGFHGDSERRIVIALRFGKPLRLHYQAYHRFNPIGKRMSIDDLIEGDMYVMGHKATGNDWKRSSIVTFRHAAERFHQGKPKYCHSLQTIKRKRGVTD